MIDSSLIYLYVDGSYDSFVYYSNPILHFSIGFLKFLEEEYYYY